MSAGRDIAAQVNEVSDPARSGYDPASPLYQLSADPSSPYYVGPVVPVLRSAEQVKAEIAQTVDLDNAGEILSGQVTPEQRGQQITDRHAAASARQVESLGEGTEMRSAGEAPRTVWETTSHEYMVAVMTNVATDPVAQSAELWRQAGNTLGDHQAKIARAIGNSATTWVGAGGDAARMRMARVAQWVAATGRGAGLSGQQQANQAEAIGHAKQQMDTNPPVPFSVVDANARLQTITDPVVFAQQMRVEQDTFNRHLAAQEQAARTMHSFDTQVGAASATPAFPAPPPSSDPVVPPPGKPGNGDVAGFGAVAAPGGRHAGSPSGPARTASPTGTASPSDVNSGTGHSPSAGPPAKSDQTTTAGYQDQTSGRPTPLPTPVLGATPDPGTGSRLGDRLSGVWTGDPLPDGGRGQGDARSGTRGPGLRGAIPDERLGAGRGVAGGAGSGAGVPRGVTEPAGTAGQRSGMGKTPGGPSMGPPGPLGRSQKEEDKERRRPEYLVDSDTPAVFESDEKVTPQTIGERRETGDPKRAGRKPR